MKRILAAVMGPLVGVSIAGAAMAQEGPARVEVASLLRGAGCSISMDGLLANDTMDANRLQSALNEMLSLGFMEFTADGGLALSPAICGLPGAPGEEVLAQAVRLNGCVMAEANAEALLLDFGLDRTNTTDFAEALIASGAATLSDNEIFRLSPAVCAGAELVAAPMPDAPQVNLRDVMVLALANNGCAMTEAQAEVILPPLGLTMADAEEIGEALIADGLARFEGGSLIGTPQLCISMGVDTAPVTMAMTGAPRDRFIQMMADNGCSITEDEFEAVRFTYGLSEDAAEAVADALIDAAQGMVMGEVFILERSVCDTATVGAMPPSGMPTSPRDVFVAAIRANGCAITQDEAAAQEAAIGLTMREMDQLADDLMDAGEASVVAGALVLTPEVCGAEPAAVSSDPVTPVEDATGVIEAPTVTVPSVTSGPSVSLAGFVAAVYASDCRMTAATARAYAATTGATLDQIKAIGDTLIALNLAQEDGDVFMLAEDYCASYRP